MVENSYNQGEVDIAYYVGGIVGKANGKITNCYNTGSIPVSYTHLDVYKRQLL